MRGHLRKRGERSWAVVVDIGHDARTGKRLQKWVSVKGTKRDAERRLAEVITRLNAGTYVEPARMTLAVYLDEWMADYVATSVRPRTAVGYASIVKMLQDALGRIPLVLLTPLQVQHYYVDMLDRGLSAQTVLHHHRLLFQALRQAVRWDMLERNIMERVTPPRRTKPNLRIVTEEEAERLLDAAAGTDFHLPIYLALSTGLRRSEILALRWSDIDLDAHTLTVSRSMVELPGNTAYWDEPKTRGSGRVVSYGPATAQMLRTRLEEHQRLPAELLELVEPRRPGEKHALRVLALPDQVCSREYGLLRPNVLSSAYRRIAARAGSWGCASTTFDTRMPVGCLRLECPSTSCRPAWGMGASARRSTSTGMCCRHRMRRRET